MSKIVIYMEHAGGTVRRASLEALGAAQTAGGEVVGVLAGDGADGAAASLPCAKAVCLTGDGAASADATAAAIAGVVRAEGASAFLCAASASGQDIAPRVAAHLDSTLLSDVTALEASGSGLQVKRPWLAGKCIATLGSSGAVFCATTRLNAFPAAEASGGAAVESTAIEASPKARVISIEAKGDAKLDVKEAPVVVSGGRGLQEPANFKLLEDLAEAFGSAAVGASRAVVDAGWRPHADQVGQTGKTVSPQLYIAAGISGAIQHLAGMRTSKVIVAINKDPDAPIFKVADYGLVGDALEILPALTAAVRAVKAGA